MTNEQVAGLGPAWTEYLRSFRACLGESRLLDHFTTYCHGLLSGLARKSVEPIALAAGSTVRALQLFVANRSWDHLRLRDQVQQRIAAEHLPAPGTPRPPDDLGVIGQIDECGQPKKGEKTPGVQRQWCGATGNPGAPGDNCIVNVHLGCSRGDFLALLDSDLYLPQSWDQDRQRCREARIPDDVVYRPKTQIALAQVKHALTNGIRFDWITFDEGYGKDPAFLLGLDSAGQTWIGEVPKSFRCWPTLPQYHSLRKEFASKQAQNVVRWSKAFIYAPWRPYVIPRRSVAPQTWHAKAAQVHLVDPKTRRPTDRTYWLIVAWNQETGERKYFVSNAPPATDLFLLLRVAFRRADVEHLFRLAKQEVGFAHFEGRGYTGLMRHMILCQLVLLFLAKQTQAINRPMRGDGPANAGGGEKGGGPGNAADRADHKPDSGRHGTAAHAGLDPAAPDAGADGRPAQWALQTLA
jgi:SRSO17 transposase